MHIYNIGYNTHEESANAQLLHEKKFSQQEFEGMIAKIVAGELKDRKEPEEGTFQYIFFEVAQGLVKRFGFRKVKFDASFCPFGWASILDEKDWKGDIGEELNWLAQAVKSNK